MNFVPLFEQLLFDFSSKFFSNFKLREKISHFDYRNVALDVGKAGGGGALICKPVCFG